MNVGDRQAALARVLTDPELEQRLRADPEAAAAELAIDVEDARRLAAISPDRIRAFRASSRVKAHRRAR